MKLVCYVKDGQEQLALLKNGLLYDADKLHPSLPVSMSMLLNYWDDAIPMLDAVSRRLEEQPDDRGIPMEAQMILSPVSYPSSVRDAYAFRQHVETARRNRGLRMIPEFDDFPVFYFSNHNNILGPGELICMPDQLQQLDFELEVAIVICRPGRNIRAGEADSYIGGYMIMNDFSARHLQMQEMKLNLGPAKGKDFGTALGPVLVTPDELESYKVPAAEGHTGNRFALSMKAFVNGGQVSEGNLGDMQWTFAEIIERASYGVQLLPGDVIGSGTVGSGCFLEINGTNKHNNPAAAERWLQEGDEIVLEVEALGELRNHIVKDSDDFSILKNR